MFRLRLSWPSFQEGRTSHSRPLQPQPQMQQKQGTWGGGTGVLTQRALHVPRRPGHACQGRDCTFLWEMRTFRGIRKKKKLTTTKKKKSDHCIAEPLRLVRAAPRPVQVYAYIHNTHTHSCTPHICTPCLAASPLMAQSGVHPCLCPQQTLTLVPHFLACGHTCWCHDQKSSALSRSLP